jgi:hypothetical protein
MPTRCVSLNSPQANATRRVDVLPGIVRDEVECRPAQPVELERHPDEGPGLRVWPQHLCRRAMASAHRSGRSDDT